MPANARSSSRHTPCRNGSSPPAIPIRTSCGRRRRRSPTSSASSHGPSGRSPGSRPVERPSRGSAPTSCGVIDDLAASENADGLLVCPCGFVSDHLEVLYDLDIEARQRAQAHGLVFDRTASMNDDQAVSPHSPRASSSAMSRSSGERRRVVVVGGGISGSVDGLVPGAPHRPGGRRDHRPGGRRATRRQAAHVSFRRACRPSTKAPTRSSPASRKRGSWPADVGLADGLTSPTNAKPAVWFRGLHPIPEGLALGVPGDVRHLASSGLLSMRGKLRAALEPLLPRRADRRRQPRPIDPQPVRQRGAGPPGRRPDRQHLRRRHRPLQPRQRAAIGRAERQPQPAPGGPSDPRRRSGCGRSDLRRAG